MTRKHFEALARALRWSRPPGGILNGTEEMKVWTECVLQTAAVCADSNPAFDFNRFQDACMGRGGK